LATAGADRSAGKKSERATAARRIIGQGRAIAGRQIGTAAAGHAGSERGAGCGPSRTRRRQLLAEFRHRAGSRTASRSTVASCTEIAERCSACRRSACRAGCEPCASRTAVAATIAVAERRRSHRLAAAALNAASVVPAG